jgi:hypothetical protein
MKTARVLAALAAILLAVTGCDDAEPANETVSIEPSSAPIKIGQSVSFAASGGYNYTWSLQNAGWGYLSSLTGPQVTYTSLYDPTNAQVQVLRVVSTIPDLHRGVTNTVPDVESSAEAYITHMPSTNSVIIP